MSKYNKPIRQGALVELFLNLISTEIFFFFIASYTLACNKRVIITCQFTELVEFQGSQDKVFSLYRDERRTLMWTQGY